MDAAQRRLNDELDTATQRLIDEARMMASSDLRAPSLLPGWSRAHVLSHLARGADAMRNLLTGARAGQDRPAYASPQARNADIEMFAVAVARCRARATATANDARHNHLLPAPTAARRHAIRGRCWSA